MCVCVRETERASEHTTFLQLGIIKSYSKVILQLSLNNKSQPSEDLKQSIPGKENYLCKAPEEEITSLAYSKRSSVWLKPSK